MLDELSALHNSGTWELVPLPFGKYVIGYMWVFAIKVGPDGTIDRLKACIVAKDYTQIFGLNYGDTFSPVAKMASVRLFIDMAALQSGLFINWTLKTHSSMAVITMSSLR
ncbi:uncharacterized protein LOC114175139 [Vigna unguiculata]|uniref:uncharacterized protein LOC114175139 n=1 Tax=Vigna unguiculata TaxID=3917 RepID=UPI001015EB0C|nr:uncharacterized protein LOC114175139 [Vigna unguiculata]